jgi:small neutral amino acid transporter SnatA (MarC family)
LKITAQNGGLIAMERLMGILLGMIAVQMLMGGVRCSWRADTGHPGT